ncbi:5-formyltetrahydrofolate cyclo-ligase [Bacillus massiliigorillae]|uniref:5-formyltetrahydrofolate cyclo-ligase n=1 Tax=Bacillus massiliigorillae TaxID=1243664 RepID=UPI0003A85A81|nr:5-formyltetrahydrofolate cyclo-ligase [Bacillus massiliigorillae]
MNKKAIQEEARAKLASMTQEDFDQKCRAIENHLFQLDIWKQARTIGLTISNSREIHTKNIIEKAWKEGKKVAIPKCNPSDRSMMFRFFNDFSQLESVYYDLLEPIMEETVEAGTDDLELMIVPGVVFDERGFRIGYGGGYYDRYLEAFKGPTVSLLLPTQLVSEIPRNQYDIPVQTLILPSGVHKVYD